ncbi:MAG: hypothetical protein AAF958_01910 [Planctomycetota bacterium]
MVSAGDPAVYPNVPLFSDGGPQIHLLWSGGRLVADAPRHRKGLLEVGDARDAEGDGVRVHVCVSARKGLPTLQFRYQSKTIQHQVTLADAYRVDWKVQDRKLGCNIRIQQPVEGPIVWTLEENGRVQTRTANHWLHLRTIGGGRFAECIEPLLDQMTPQQTLSRLQQDAETAMLRRLMESPLHPTLVSKAGVQQCVAALDAPTRFERHCARRRLADMGVHAVAHLRKMDEADMTPQQRRDVRQILDRFSITRRDLPGDLAARLVCDHDYWRDRIDVGGGVVANVILQSHLRDIGLGQNLDATRIAHASKVARLSESETKK